MREGEPSRGRGSSQSLRTQGRPAAAVLWLDQALSTETQDPKTAAQVGKPPVLPQMAAGTPSVPNDSPWKREIRLRVRMQSKKPWTTLPLSK